MKETQTDSTKKHIAAVTGLSALLALYGLVVGAVSVGMDRRVEPWWLGFVLVGVLGLSISRVLKSLAAGKGTSGEPE